MYLLMYLGPQFGKGVGKEAAERLAELTSLDSALMKKRLLNRLESALTNLLDLKSFRFCTYKKRGEWGGRVTASRYRRETLT